MAAQQQQRVLEVEQRQQVVQERTKDEKLLDDIRAKGIDELERLSEPIQAPFRVRRKTTFEFLKRDPTNITLVQTAHASADQELNLYTRGFSMTEI